ncbi:phosphorylase [Leptothermofonsia sp. ETS-13]|uniref:5'-methylthioadenosine/S-adenosylhomocysteine nucleosidase family protein n=1 Tax=Leptothermofonsia sp. ETS-13 TaxID=3035696 RepID=UPI003BA208A1
MPRSTFPIQIILVPQGIEYRAVCQGLGKVANPPRVLPVPVGPLSLNRYLEGLYQDGCFAYPASILMMGLCGSLSPQYAVGDIVLYRECFYHSLPPLLCDRPLTSLLRQKLGEQIPLVKALTSDRVVCSVAEKRSLSLYADVVDMEGYAALKFFQQVGIAIATLRVISDDCHHDLPDLSAAFASDGSLQILPLGLSMIRQPIAATRMIQGSLQGLKVLQTLTSALFTV